MRLKHNYLEIITVEPKEEHQLIPDLILIPGVSHTASCWRFFQQVLADCGIRSHAVSLRGHGKSAGQERVLENRFSDYILDIYQVVSELHLQQKSYILAGHSMGGYVAQVFFQQQNIGNLCGLILLATLTPKIAREILTIERLSLNRTREQTFLKSVITQDFLPLFSSEEKVRASFFTPTTSPALVQYCWKHLCSEPFRIMLDVLEAPSPENTPFHRSPVLLVGAERDQVMPSSLLQQTGRVYGVEPITFAGLGHDLMLDDAGVGYQTVARYISTWIKSIYTDPQAER